MSANESTVIQLNFRTPAGSLLNLYCKDHTDAETQLDALTELAGRIGEVEALLGAVSTVATTPPSGGRQSTPQAAAPSSGGGDIPVCSHGTYEYRSGTNQKTGKAWSGYFCKSKDRNDQHDPKWNR